MAQKVTVAEPEPIVAPEGHVAVWLKDAPGGDRVHLLQRTSVGDLRELTVPGHWPGHREIAVCRRASAETHGLPTFAFIGDRNI